MILQQIVNVFRTVWPHNAARGITQTLKRSENRLRRLCCKALTNDASMEQRAQSCSRLLSDRLYTHNGNHCITLSHVRCLGKQ